MSINSSLILMTGTIAPQYFTTKGCGKSVNVVLTDANERLLQYERAITYMIQESAFRYIVFVENTDYPFVSEKYYELAIKYNKKFEFLRCKLNYDEIRLMREKGKSYGESKLISYAILNSGLIREVDTIYKLTGRVILKNSSEVLRGDAHARNEFICKNKIGWCNTEFFKVNKADFINFFLNAEGQTNDYKNMSIERIYYQIAKKNKMEIKAFRRYPILHGRVASTFNRQYDKTKWEIIVCNLLCLTGYYDMKY